MKTKSHFPLVLFLCVLAGIAGYGVFGAKRSATTRPGISGDNGVPGASSAARNTAEQHISGKTHPAAPVPAASPIDPQPIAADIPAPMNPDFRLRPFKAVKFTSTHQWTAEDCLTDAAIHQLAHNALEEERLKNENQWTLRRQLVYRNEKTGDFVAELENGTRKQFVIPGFDGAEFIVNVQRLERFNDDGFGLQGTIDGYPGSRFRLGYAQGHESWTIDIPSQGLRYEGQPREENEVIVNHIDPSEYDKHQPPMGEPIRNDDVAAPSSK